MPGDFRDITTAPRDGTVIEIMHADCGAFSMRWNAVGGNSLFQPGEIGIWETPDGSMTWSEVRGCGPSHWRPISAEAA